MSDRPSTRLPSGRPITTNHLIVRAMQRTGSNAGQPTTYSANKASAILTRVMEQGEYLSDAAKAEGVAASTLYTWRHAHPELAEAIAIARAVGADSRLAEACRELDQAEGKDDITKAQHRLRHAQWYAERCAPAEFSDIGARGAGQVAQSLSALLDQMAQGGGETIDAQPVEDAEEISDDE